MKVSYELVFLHNETASQLYFKTLATDNMNSNSLYTDADFHGD